MNDDNLLAINTERLRLKMLDPSYVKVIYEYYCRNQTSFSEFIPFNNEFFTSSELFLKHLWDEFDLIINKRALRFYLFELDNINCSKIIGDISVSNIIYGCMQSCQLGYKLDKSSTGAGFMFEALKRVISLLFSELNLHRIESYILPSNKKSIRLIERLNFKLEGTSEKFIFINDNWEDHLRYFLINS